STAHAEINHNLFLYPPDWKIPFVPHVQLRVDEGAALAGHLEMVVVGYGTHLFLHYHMAEERLPGHTGLEIPNIQCFRYLLFDKCFQPYLLVPEQYLDVLFADDTVRNILVQR